MKTKNYFWMLAMAAGMVVAVAPLNGCKKGNNDENDNDAGNDDENIVDVESTLPDSIKNGSDFYIIFMDEVSVTSLGSKVKEPTMLRDYDIWTAGETMEGGESVGVNSWGAPEEYPALRATNQGWCGGSIVAKLEEFETVPDLSPIMEDGFYFHFAIKSPSNQANVGWNFFFYSEGDDVAYNFGPTAPGDAVHGGNYAHDGEWHHFEIPVSELAAKGYLWTEPLNINGNNAEGRRALLGFLGAPYVAGAELNLDAIFFYKKPVKD
jgi:hypothetical protein